jgi:hypothetical protein
MHLLELLVWMLGALASCLQVPEILSQGKSSCQQFLLLQRKAAASHLEEAQALLRQRW